MQEVEKITIVEGPPPTFELSNDAWLLGLVEGLLPSQVFRCQLRTFNGASLVERCQRAWGSGLPVHLEYRNSEGLTQQVPIVAVRWTEISEGHLLLLWVRIDEEDIEFEYGFDIDDFDDEFDDFDELDDFDDTDFNLF